MNVTAPQRAAKPDPGIDPVYLTRDDLARTFNPVTPYERMLLLNAAQAWHRLQKARELDRRFFETTDPLEVFTKNADAFKTLTRYVTDCERSWRHAIEAIERAIRNRTAAERKQTSTGRLRPQIDGPELLATNPSTTINRTATIVPRR
jgi:hypothetical protein